MSIHKFTLPDSFAHYDTTGLQELQKWGRLVAKLFRLLLCGLCSICSAPLYEQLYPDHRRVGSRCEGTRAIKIRSTNAGLCVSQRVQTYALRTCARTS